VRHGMFTQSKNSCISGITASRRVRLGNPKRVSMNLRMAVVSIGVCETKCFFANGEITITGTRNPVMLKIPGLSCGASARVFVLKHLAHLISAATYPNHNENGDDDYKQAIQMHRYSRAEGRRRNQLLRRY